MSDGTFEFLKQFRSFCLGRGLLVSVGNEFNAKHESPSSNITYD